MAQDIEVREYEPKIRNLCTGHYGKIYDLHWSSDSNAIVTGSQDGKLIIWSSYSGAKQSVITLISPWVMMCCFSPTSQYIASGGLDNTLSIFRSNGSIHNELYQELKKHDGYLSCARFINDGEIISASGDGTCILWDVEKQSIKNIFNDHLADIMSIDLNENLFVSGSVDGTAKIWDYRSSDRCIVNLMAHNKDINAVKWFTDLQSIVTGSDDGTLKLLDMRTYRELNEYSDKDNISLYGVDPAGVTSIDVSLSGSYIFAAYDNGNVYMWSSLHAQQICDMPHDSRVSSLAVSHDGYAIATGCWDFCLRVFL